jgi:hypothetical protein
MNAERGATAAPSVRIMRMQQHARLVGTEAAIDGAVRAVHAIPISDRTAPVRQRLLAALEALRATIHGELGEAS